TAQRFSTKKKKSTRTLTDTRYWRIVSPPNYGVRSHFSTVRYKAFVHKPVDNLGADIPSI
ncbi:MAG: hypothetical protein AB1704_38710, partial [Pseudomonadota bacterium]